MAKTPTRGEEPQLLDFDIKNPAAREIFCAALTGVCATMSPKQAVVYANAVMLEIQRRTKDIKS